MPLLRVAGHFRAAVYRGDQAVRLAGRSCYCNFCCMSACVRVWACERASGRSAASLSLSRSPPPPPPIYTFFFLSVWSFLHCVLVTRRPPSGQSTLQGNQSLALWAGRNPSCLWNGRFAIDTRRTRRTLFTCRKDSQVSWWRGIWHGCTTVPLLVYTLLYFILLYYII